MHGRGPEFIPNNPEKRRRMFRRGNERKLLEEVGASDEYSQVGAFPFQIFMDKVLQGDPITEKKEENDPMQFFPENNIHLLSTPLFVEDHEEDIIDLDLIHPVMATRRIVDEHVVSIIVGQRRAEMYSYPIIQRKIAYQVWFCIEGSCLRLESISVFQHPDVLRALIEELAMLKVGNDDDLFASKHYLTNLYFSLTEKK